VDDRAPAQLADADRALISANPQDLLMIRAPAAG
jgi:hypothetical protein